MKKLVIIVVSLLLFTSSYSQLIDFKKDRLWADGGIGFSDLPGDAGGLTSLISLNFLKDSVLYKGRFLSTTELKLFSKPSNEYLEFSLMAGKGIIRSGGHIIFSTGFGILAGFEQDELLYREETDGIFSRSVYSRDSFLTPCIPVEIDLQLNPFKFLGLGFTVFANFNIENPFYGGALKISLGKVR